MNDNLLFYSLVTIFTLHQQNILGHPRIETNALVHGRVLFSVHHTSSNGAIKRRTRELRVKTGTDLKKRFFLKWPETFITYVPHMFLSQQSVSNFMCYTIFITRICFIFEDSTETWNFCAKIPT